MRGLKRPVHLKTPPTPCSGAGRLEDAECDLRTTLERSAADASMAAGAMCKHIATHPRLEPLRPQPGFADLVAEGTRGPRKGIYGVLNTPPPSVPA